MSPRISQFVCAASLRVIRLRLTVRGRPSGGLAVANHSSWLDILVLNAADRPCFVAKSEVAGWPGIGLLARATGTVFIRRDRRDVAAQRDILASRLAAGDRLLVFPEGTSTDGRRLLAFKPALFAAVCGASHVQPVTVIWHAPPGADPRFYGWWGDMALAPHLLRVLARRPQGSVEVIYHPPIAGADHPSRKPLAAACEAAVRSGFGPYDMAATSAPSAATGSSARQISSPIPKKSA